MSRHPETVVMPNTRLRQARLRTVSPHRVGQCMSRPELADAVNAALDRLYPRRELVTQYVDARWVGKLERGEHRWPSRERRAALRHVLGVTTDTEVGLYSPRRTHSGSMTQALPGNRGEVDTPSHEPLQAKDPQARTDLAEAHTLDLARRHPNTYAPFRPAALDRPAQDWLNGVEAEPLIAQHGQLLREVDVQSAAQRLKTLREQDHRLGAGGAAAATLTFIQDTFRTLLSGKCDDPLLRTEAFRIAIGARELAGYQAVDSGADGVAQRHYLHALSLATRAGDRAFGAYLLGVSLGHLALHCGRADRSLRVAQIALAGLPADTTPAVRSGLWAVIARSHARLGDEPGCTVALRTAEANLASINPAHEPGWIAYLTPAYLADEVAHCMFDLDRHETARREIRHAVEGVGVARVRRLAIDTALLASSLAAVGRIDEACAHGRDAVDFAAQTQSARAVQRVAQVRADLVPYEQSRPVVELIDYMVETLPAAL